MPTQGHLSSEGLPTLAGLLEQRAMTNGDLVFAAFPEVSVTYGALLRQATAFAKGLLAAGLRPRAHVAIFMPNCVDFLVAHYAVQLTGCVSVLLNARYKQFELRQVIEHCDAQFLLTTDVIDEHVNLADVLFSTYPELSAGQSGEMLKIPCAPRLEKIILFGTKRATAMLGAEAVARAGTEVPDERLVLARSGREAEETAVMLYTSGTTAAPKGCELSHAGLQRSWGIFTRTVNLTVGEKVWDPMPFFHTGGVGLMTGIMACGATIVSAPHFDAEVTVDLILAQRVEHLYPGFHLLGVPVLASSRYNATSFNFVRSVVVIGPLGTMRKIQSLLPPGAKVMNLFGMSEASGLITLTPPEANEEQRLTTNGRTLPGTEVRIVDPQSGVVAAPDVAGEIQFRGGGAFRGYYKDPVATRSAILADGWVRTGDIGTLDADGWLRYAGRYKELLRVGGENFAAAEVESFLSGHPAVKFVQVIGSPDERMGEVPVAFVERNAGSVASEQDIIGFCAGKIAKFKIPRQVVFVTEWPMSSTKIQKFKLRELLP
jgi:acyl-CoA synthetase (AMP-forming)/AMP-acid ligase II